MQLLEKESEVLDLSEDVSELICNLFDGMIEFISVEKIENIA